VCANGSINHHYSTEPPNGADYQSNPSSKHQRQAMKCGRRRPRLVRRLCFAGLSRPIKRPSFFSFFLKT